MLVSSCAVAAAAGRPLSVLRSGPWLRPGRQHLASVGRELYCQYIRLSHICKTNTGLIQNKTKLQNPQEHASEPAMPQFAQAITQLDCCGVPRSLQACQLVLCKSKEFLKLNSSARVIPYSVALKLEIPTTPAHNP